MLQIDRWRAPLLCTQRRLRKKTKKKKKKSLQKCCATQHDVRAQQQTREQTHKSATSGAHKQRLTGSFADFLQFFIFLRKRQSCASKRLCKKKKNRKEHAIECREQTKKKKKKKEEESDIKTPIVTLCGLWFHLICRQKKFLKFKSIFKKHPRVELSFKSIA